MDATPASLGICLIVPVSVSAVVNRPWKAGEPAIAVAKVRGPADALAMIEPLASKLGGYFYFHGARGAFLLELGRTEEARVAFDRAIALANTPAEAAHIREQLDRLSGAAL